MKRILSKAEKPMAVIMTTGFRILSDVEIAYWVVIYVRSF